MRILAAIACGGLLVLPAGAGERQALADDRPAPSLEVLLRGMDRASYLYLDTALRFACTETIVESGTGPKSVHRFEYLFVYDKEHGFQDYRTWRVGKDRLPVNPDDVGVGLFLERAYMWVLLFNRTRQDKYNYEIVNLETIDGVATVQVRFRPISPYKDGINEWIGTAWVDPSTYQIVKVEAMKAADLEAFMAMQQNKGKDHPLSEHEASSHPADKSQRAPEKGPGRFQRVEGVTTKFSVLKNGMRFPSEVKLASTNYYLSSEGRKPEEVSQVESKQSYTKYSFYAVHTSEEVKRLLSSSP
jgi:hypothetical protein